MENFRLVVEYDGTAYHGWQRQKADRTIQGEIEKALATMTGKSVSLAGSGRTDAGVHAIGQTASFNSDAGLSPDIYFKGLNSLLPDDILIRVCESVDPAFHARYNARSKIYQYRILNRDMPSIMERHYVWHIRRQLNIEAMQKAVSYLVGEHDFKAFEGTGSPRTSTVRHVIRAGIRETKGDQILFDIEADGFLRYMVRNIVGTLVDVGKGRIPGEDVNRIFLSRDRNQAGATAPAKGLFLMKVNY
ncbi:MAG: tRNA pseudouridine(38-40) synthase TruA [Deltaproteobacteria bacterium]|nr:MAG: tRNA pseudouridine(38-40) synthase TruA [Deltaproteobacteria bacterium]